MYVHISILSEAGLFGKQNFLLPSYLLLTHPKATGTPPECLRCPVREVLEWVLRVIRARREDGGLWFFFNTEKSRVNYLNHREKQS
jgi:hypothetical protein